MEEMIPMSNKIPQLTISLLISNRLDTIPRCLDSLRLILDAIPSELILIDTSKNPEVNALLKTYTDKVYEFDWCNDFAKARNEGVRRAKGEWFMFLDDDEWFVEVQPIIDFFKSGEYKEYNLAHYQIRNFEDVEYTIYSDCWVSRMVRLEDGIVFVGKIHEYFANLRGKEKHLNAMAYHSGYIFDTEEKRLARAERNIPLLLEMLEEEPDNIRWKVQLVQEKRSLKEWEWIESYCKECIESITDKDRLDIRTHFSTFYAALVEALMFQGKHNESHRWCEKALEDERSTELLKALIYNRIAENHLALRDWEKAIEYAKVYLKEYECLSKNKVLMQEQCQALLVRHVFDMSTLQKAYGLLIYGDLKKGSTKVLSEYYDRLSWGEEFNFVTDMLARLLVEVMTQEEEQPILVQALKDACKHEQLRNVVCAHTQNLEVENPEAFLQLVPMYAKVESDFWYIWYVKMIYGDLQGDKKAVEAAIEGLLCAISNVFYLAEKVYEISAKYEIELPLLWEKVTGDTWLVQMNAYVAGVKNEHLHRTHKLLTNSFGPNGWATVSFEVAVLEKRIMAGPEHLWNLETYYDVLKKYPKLKFVFYNASEDKVGDENDLPRTVQAALRIQEYIDIEPQDKIRAINKLKEAVDICPEFADGIGEFLHFYSDLERQRMAKQKKEMSQLRNQVMGQVQVMIANGQYQEALQIIQQLKQMFPGDLEVVALGLEVRAKTLE